MIDACIQQEVKQNFRDWTYEGLSFLLQQEQFREMAITALSKFLILNQSVEFACNNLYYEIFASVEGGYVINIYSSDEKDDEGKFIEVNLIDGGLCTGGARDAIEFML